MDAPPTPKLLASRQVVLAVHHVHKTHGREGRATFHFTPAHFGSAAGWVYRALASLARASEKSPVYTSLVNSLRTQLEAAAKIPGWAQLAQKQEDELTVEELVAFYRLLDESYPSIVAMSTRNSLCQFRSFIRRYLAADGKFNEHTKLNRVYKSNLKVKKSSRGTVSDLLDLQSPIPYPIAALPHSSPKELSRLTLQKRQTTLARLEAGCAAHFARFRAFGEWLAEIENSTYSQETLRKIELGFNAELKNQRLKAIAFQFSPEIRLGASLQILRAGYAYEKPETRSIVFVSWFENIQKMADLRMPFMGKGIWSIFLFPQVGDAVMLYACALQVQIRTAWNFESILSLVGSCVRRLESGLFIQSIKGKTDDETPPYVVPYEDKETIFALEFLLEREQFQVALGLVAPGGSLFTSSLTGKITALNSGWIKFQKLYELPAYSPEQVRNEVLAFVAAEKGPRAAADKAGHADLSNIGTYSEDEEKKATNSAANLQFQRTLETDIRDSVERPPSAQSNWPSLTRVGDGASCSAPSLPPDLDWLAGEVCKAEHCHSEGGCPNRMIVVSEAAMAELAATVDYYKDSWQRLVSENPTKFKLIHLPRIVFVRTFEHVLFSGPYSGVYAKVKRKS